MAVTGESKAVPVITIKSMGSGGRAPFILNVDCKYV